MNARLLLASALVGTLVLAGVPARAGGGEVGIEATGRMTLSASSSAYVDLSIPQKARLSLNYWTKKGASTPRFSRGDGLASVVLASLDTVGITYSAFRLPKAKGILQRKVSLGPELCQLQRYCEVEPGDYRLFLVTDVPATAQIELRGLSGSSTLELVHEVTGDISKATASYFHRTPDGSAEVAAHGAGFSPTLTGTSNFVFGAFWFHGPNEPFGEAPADKPLLQVGATGQCTFDGSPPAESYAPGCPSGNNDFNVTTLRALDDFGALQWGAMSNIGPGQIGMGYYAWHTGIRDPGFIGFWLDLTG